MLKFQKIIMVYSAVRLDIVIQALSIRNVLKDRDVSSRDYGCHKAMNILTCWLTVLQEHMLGLQ